MLVTACLLVAHSLTACDLSYGGLGITNYSAVISVQVARFNAWLVCLTPRVVL